jgi:putative hydrolase of HD superfamily
MYEDRLAQQLAFVIELDKLKQILRQTLLTDGSRRENSAEHSWHLALMAIVLAEHADEPIEVGRVIKMVLVHDIVEIDAGDTFAYDTLGAIDQAEREARAADRVFGMLPADQAAEVRALWDEFERRETPEARFAVALDRLQPLLHNYHTAGGTWRRHGVTLEMVEARCGPIEGGSQALWCYARAMLDDAVAAGMIAHGDEATAPSQP